MTVTAKLALEDGTVFRDLGVPPFSPDTDRGMICGSLAFNLDVKTLLENAGLREGANSDPAEFVVEKAFVGEGIEDQVGEFEVGPQTERAVRMHGEEIKFHALLAQPVHFLVKSRFGHTIDDSMR